MDLVVDLNFRMDSSALYSDIVLPAASWYEKTDLNSTDLHSFIHPLSASHRAGVGVEVGLEDLPRSREGRPAKLAEEYFSRAAEGHCGLTDRARLGRRRSPNQKSEGLVPRGVRGDPRQDHAQPCRRGARLHEDLRQIHQRSAIKHPEGRPGCARQPLRLCADVYDEMLERRTTSQVENAGTARSIRRSKEDEWAANAVLHLSSLTNGDAERSCLRERWRRRRGSTWSISPSGQQGRAR